MPLFLSDDEFERHSNDVHAVAQKADEFITNLYAQLETVKAQADAASITAEQTCSMLEQKYISLSSDYSDLEYRLSEYDANLQQRASEVAQVQAEKHQFHLKEIEKDGELERLKAEVSELHKSKRQLMMLVEQKDAEISEKNSFIKSYLDKIVNLTENAAEKEARLSKIESEMARQKGTCERLVQEKEVIERHNVWLNEELTKKVDSLNALRRNIAEIEADMSAKVADVEKQYNECSSSLKWHKDRVAELEMKLTSLQGDLCSAKDAAAVTEERYGAEIATLTKLVDLYKESSEEWSKKAGELEGVIKALEMHLSQVENEYKEKLEKEESIRVQAEKEVAELKEKLAKLEAEIEASRKSCELNILPLANFSTEALMRSFDTDDFTRDDHMIVPRVPAGVSGTALAASLLKDGWSLAQLYGKYQEAVDALRHEQLGRKQTQAVLERVLLEIEEKASVILDERAEHDKMAEAYSHMNQKLQKSLSDQANMEKVILELKADLKRRERDYEMSQKEIADLEKQVTILLKECRDIQLRCGSYRDQYADDELISPPTDVNPDIDAEKVISEQLLTFRDINGLVEQNAKLRRLVRSFSDQIQNREIELKEQFDMELQKHDEVAASKVALVLERAEEQGHMIESLHSSVAMYKRLYEEEHKLRSSLPSADAASASVSEDGRKDLMQLLHEGSQDSTKKIQQLGERLRCLEDELANRRSEIILLRSERDKLALEAAFSHDKLERFMKEFDHQREETNAILARNVEFSQLVVDYQRRLRESSESLHAAEELSRKLTMEVSVLKNEKELLSNSEKRACIEVRDLSERVHRLQTTLDTIQSTEQVREESRAADRRKQEEYIKQLEREWAEAKKELQEERDNARLLSHDREQTIKDAMRQLEETGKELASALRAVSAAEARAAVAESRCTDLERNIRSSDVKGGDRDGGYEPSSSSTVEIAGDLAMAKEEIERLKLEAEACKNHMHQYKSIAEVNEAALRQMESAHESFRIEADKMKRSLEAEVQSLRTRVTELEDESNVRSREAASAATEKEESLLSAIANITALKEENATKMSQVATLETQLSSFKEDLEREQQRWRTAQANYERQVILQSETIQELTKTSQALALLQEEASELRKEADVYRSENNQLKANWEVEKSTLEKSRDDFEKKYNEINEQNKILHKHLEAMHIKLAENEHVSAGLSSTSTSADSDSGAGLQSVVNYLRRSKEIAETEISLLKQEKLRLQSQVEKASKEAEAAQASLNAERAKSSRSLFTDDEFKSLQLQVREINLLRESNLQLREENKHNFEECQKLRELSQKAKVESENLQTLLREKEIEAEAARKETEMERTQKQYLEKRVSELLEKYKSVDAEDYDRVKSDIKHLQAEIGKKDAQIEEMRRLVVEKDNTIAKLEKDLSEIKSEQSERLQAESKQKADLEKQRRLVYQLKRKAEALAKEKLSDALQRELLSKGKEELSKENESLLKQLEDLKHGKKLATDATGEQTTREKENEKDARIEILERTVRKLREDVKKEREDNKKEKDRRQSIEKAIQTKVSFVEQERKKIEDEQEKHKEAVRRISNELEKLKHASDSLPEGTLVIQHLSGTALDDLPGAYGFAIENFEKSARSVLIELGAQNQPGNSSVMDSGAVSTGSGNEAPGALPSVPPAGPPAKTSEDKKKTSLPKTNVETRRFGRKLIRPRLGKSEQPLGDRDTEMSDIGGSGTAGKSASIQETEADTNPDTSARKRTAASSAAELHGGSFLAADMSTDVAGPASKRSKGSEHTEVDSQVETAPPENAENPSAVDEPLNAGDDFAHDITEEGTGGDKDEIETSQEITEEPGEHKQHDEMSQPDVPNQDENVLEENTDKPSEMDDAVDDESMLQADQETHEANVDAENKEAILDGDNKEEGDFVSEVPDPDGRVETSVPLVSQDATEGQTETPGASPMVSPARVDEETYVAATEDESEMSTPEDSNAEQNEEGEITEDTAEMSDKGNDANLGGEISDKGHEQSVGEADQISDANLGPPGGSSTGIIEVTNPKDSSSSAVVTGEEAKQPAQAGSSSTTINLNERARERSMLRLRELSPSPGGRGRGRPVTRAGRGRVRGRRQS